MSDGPPSLQCTLCPAKMPLDAKRCPICGTPAPPIPREAASRPTEPGYAPRNAVQPDPTLPPPARPGTVPDPPRSAGGPRRPDPELGSTFPRGSPVGPRPANLWVDAVRKGIENIAVFEGRTGRRDFWIFNLCIALSSIVLQVIISVILDEGQSLNFGLSVLAGLATLSSGVRRLHDVDRSGYWSLLGATIIGIPLVLYWLIQPGAPGPNRFGHSEIP